MMTDDERREVAARLREIEQGVIGALIPTGELAESILRAIDYGRSDAMTPYGRLADLIEPVDGFDLDTVQRVCFECMEGCDEPEWTLYTTIHDAIARYRRGESGPTYDRDALLALAEDVDEAAAMAVVADASKGVKLLADMLLDIARRIREACGEVG